MGTASSEGLSEQQALFVDAWKDAAGECNADFPGRAQMGPARCAPFMTWMMVAEWDDGLGTMLPIYTGTRLDGLMGQSMTGKSPKQMLQNKAHQAMHGKVISYLFEAKAGVLVEGSGRRETGEGFSIQQLRLPLLSDGKRGVISLFEPSTSIELGEEPGTSAATLSIRRVQPLDIGFGAPPLDLS